MSVTTTHPPGTFCWPELCSGAAVVTLWHMPESKRFYSSLFGWNSSDMMPGKAHWLPYFQVKDADKSAAQVEELGGKICGAAMDIPTISDSQGAEFAMIKPADR